MCVAHELLFRAGMRLHLVLALAVVGCDSARTTSLDGRRSAVDAGRPVDVGRPIDGGLPVDAGHTPDSGERSRPCSVLREADCIAAAQCGPHYCEGCAGDRSFIGCSEPDMPLPGCPPIACPDCSTAQSRAACAGLGSCHWDECPSCDGEPPVGVCLGPNEGIACPAVECEPECPELDEQACAARPDCHRVFDGTPQPQCLCDAPGCCTEFSRCAYGGSANCGPEMVACGIPEPLCEGPYVVAYQGACYEGCALGTDCAP